MPKKRPPNALEAFFPDGRVYEYFLQRLRLLTSDKTPALTVFEIRDIANPVEACIEVVLRIPGLRITNPATGKQMLSTGWLKKHFEAAATQQAYRNAFAEYLASSIPDGHPEAHLRPKFKHIGDGSPGDLPARADLYIWHQELVDHLTAAKKWLCERKQPNSSISKRDREAFLNAISHPMFWWAKYIKQGQITLEMIVDRSPGHNAKQVLALKYAKSYETIRLRLSRKEV